MEAGSFCYKNNYQLSIFPNAVTLSERSESNGYNIRRSSLGKWNHLYITPPGLYPFEALVEIFDFVAGLVQRVPKKPNEMKADLQNSTASQGDCLPLVFCLEILRLQRLSPFPLRMTNWEDCRLIGINHLFYVKTSRLSAVEADCFRYKTANW